MSCHLSSQPFRYQMHSKYLEILVCEIIQLCLHRLHNDFAPHKHWFHEYAPDCLIHWERHEMISHLSEFQAHVPQNFFFQSFFSFICGPADHRGIGRCGSSFCELHSQVALLSHEVASLQCLQWLTLPCSPQSLLASFVIAGCCSTPTTESALLSFSNFNVC